MNTGQHLLQAIVDQPDDDAVRLVYSDWLEDQGDTARAEFIRTQIERERLSPNDTKHCSLWNREDELHRFHSKKWTPTPPPGTYFTVTYRRGFPDQLRICANEEPAAITRYVPRVLRLCPTIRSLAFGDRRPEESPQSGLVGWDDNPPIVADSTPPEPMLALFRLTSLRRIAHFQFIASYLPREVCALLAQARTLNGLRQLNLTGMGVTEAEMGELLQARWFPQLIELRADPGSQYHDAIGMGFSTETISISDDALVALARSPVVQNLRRLIVPRLENRFAARVLVALMASPYLAHLDQLDLGHASTWLDDATTPEQQAEAIRLHWQWFPRPA